MTRPPWRYMFKLIRSPGKPVTRSLSQGAVKIKKPLQEKKNNRLNSLDGHFPLTFIDSEASSE